MFKIKHNSDSTIKYKARLVAKGFTQRYGLDYQETFSPVIRFSTFRLLVATAIRLGMAIDHIDMETAFLNGELHETVFMEQPEGCISEQYPEKVCLLNRALYGLKQASRVWNENVDKILNKLGFEKSNYEPCVYYKRKDKCFILFALYVDDFLLIYNNSELCKKVKKELTKEFIIRDLGRIKYFLGMNIEYSCNNIVISQKDYILRLLTKYGMSEANPVSTPLVLNSKVSDKNTESEKCGSDVPYQGLIGSLMYLAQI